MVSIFNFKTKEKEIYSPADGTLVSLEDVPDEVFAEKMLGDGIAILPENGHFFSPADGTIISVADTLHAYCIKTEDGLEILIHIGINTVELNGQGFKALVQNNQKIKKGGPMAEVDLTLLREKGLSPVTPVLITNSDALSTLNYAKGKVKTATPILFYTKK